jgi:hypothetical protein
MSTPPTWIAATHPAIQSMWASSTQRAIERSGAIATSHTYTKAPEDISQSESTTSGTSQLPNETRDSTEEDDDAPRPKRRQINVPKQFLD